MRSLRGTRRRLAGGWITPCIRYVRSVPPMSGESSDTPQHARRARLRALLTQSESGKAAGLAAATLANNAIQLVFTIVFTRLLGATDYGSLAVLISAFLILLVAGSAVQVAAARETALGRLGDGEKLAATVTAWTRWLAL